MPISGWARDNLLKTSANMGQWKGCDVKVGSETIRLGTYAHANRWHLQDQSVGDMLAG